MMFARELAASMEVSFVERDLVLEDLLTADEVMLSSTPNCLLPVASVNAKDVGDGAPRRSWHCR